MSTSQVVYQFLAGVQNRAPPPGLGPDDLALLQQLQLVRTLGAGEFAALQQEVANLSAAQGAVQTEEQERARLAAQVGQETARTHSIRFVFEGHDRKEAELERARQDAAALQGLQGDLNAKEQRFADLLAKKSLLDTLVPLSGGYVALTGAGQLQVRDMAVRMYRISDLPFATYVAQTQAVDRELNDLADRGAQYAAALQAPLGGYDRSHLWSVALGLAKNQPEVAAGTATLLTAWNGLGPLAHNDENRLLSAEVLAAIPRPVEQSLAALGPVDEAVRRLGVPRESSLGVASTLLLGQRADGTLALPSLQSFLAVTRSFDAAALLAILNVPLPELTGKFQTLRGWFTGWGFQASEDVELASAFLACSELPLTGLDTKLGILTRGMARYLQFPLVGAAVLASVATLEANETLRLLEQAYDVVGRRAMPMSEPELICLAVRLVHGIRDETIGQLDTTAAAPPAPPAGAYLYGPRFLLLPAIVAHGSYYSTFSAFGGVHPGHVNVMGGFGG